MANVTTLDKRRRGTFPQPFRPGDMFRRQVIGAEKVVFSLVKPAEVPVVKPVNVKGWLMLPRQASRKQIAAAIRTDREDQ